MGTEARDRARLGGTVGLVLLAAVALGCGKTATCRDGTVFLTLRFESYPTATRLDIDVMVQGAATPQHTMLTLPNGVGSGGVEVNFPNGYPQGEDVFLTLTLYAQTTQLAQRMLRVSLPQTCADLDVSFTPGVDGGAGGATGRGGSGGATARGGAGGAAGAGGATGVAGTTGVAGATGVAGTTGGAGATGVAGTTGVAGMTGRGGATGVAGMTGVAGSGGRGGGPAGAGGSCVSAGAEKCFNGVDDDCDGQIDCADTDCVPTTQCVALDPAAGQIGVMTGATAACPSGYGTATALLSGLTPGTCSGCSCSAPPAIKCSTTVASFQNSMQCADATYSGQSAGSWAMGQEGPNCSIPGWSTATGGTVGGLSATAFVGTVSGGCTAAGSPHVSVPTWGGSGQYCATVSVGAGCGTGKVCVPASPAKVCQMFEGTHACPTGLSGASWYTGYSGSQSCGACTCGNPTGGSCTGLRLTIGSDYTCSGVSSIVGTGGRWCVAIGSSGVYQPGVAIIGMPVQATCAAVSAVSGTLTPTGQKTLCCP